MVLFKKLVHLFSQAEDHPGTPAPPEAPSFLPVGEKPPATPESIPPEAPSASTPQPDAPAPVSPGAPAAEEKPEAQGGGRYVYARYISVRDSLICFKSVDGLYFGQARAHFTHAQPDLRIGEYAWFQTGDPGRGVFWHKMRNPASLPAESQSFKQHYQVGDRLILPIIGKTETSIKVALGPTLFSFVERGRMPARSAASTTSGSRWIPSCNPKIRSRKRKKRRRTPDVLRGCFLEDIFLRDTIAAPLQA